MTNAFWFGIINTTQEKFGKIALPQYIAGCKVYIARAIREAIQKVSRHNKGAACFAFGERNPANLALLAEHEVTAENYHRIQNVIDENNREIAKIEAELPGLRNELRDTVDTLDTLEKVMGKTLVQGLVDEHKPRLQADFVPNGLRVAKL